MSSITSDLSNPSNPSAAVTADRRARRAPAATTAARVVLIVHGVLIGLLGAVLLNHEDIPQVLAIASIVEGVARIALGLLLREGARHLRIVAIVLCALGAVAAALNPPFGIVGVALNAAVVRCLCNDESKRFLGA